MCTLGCFTNSDCTNTYGYPEGTICGTSATAGRGYPPVEEGVCYAPQCTEGSCDAHIATCVEETGLCTGTPCEGVDTSTCETPDGMFCIDDQCAVCDNSDPATTCSDNEICSENTGACT
jgi:hypothetical protein